jgi:hypothetical protein
LSEIVRSESRKYKNRAPLPPLRLGQAHFLRPREAVRRSELVDGSGQHVRRHEGCALLRTQANHRR